MDGYGYGSRIGNEFHIRYVINDALLMAMYWLAGQCVGDFGVVMHIMD